MLARSTRLPPHPNTKRESGDETSAAAKASKFQFILKWHVNEQLTIINFTEYYTHYTKINHFILIQKYIKNTSSDMFKE